MTRIATPPDYNKTTERFARSMGDGRLCDAESAQAIFKDFDVLDSLSLDPANAASSGEHARWAYEMADAMLEARTQ